MTYSPDLLDRTRATLNVARPSCPIPPRAKLGPHDDQRLAGKVQLCGRRLMLIDAQKCSRPVHGAVTASAFWVRQVLEVRPSSSVPSLSSQGSNTRATRRGRNRPEIAQ